VNAEKNGHFAYRARATAKGGIGYNSAQNPGRADLDAIALPLVGWVSLILTGAGLSSWRMAAAILLPGLSAAAAFAAAYDLARQARSDMLLNGS
jgi:hypothetical protein